MKIEFGGGETPRRPDYVQCDVRSIGGTVDYCCNAWEIHGLIFEACVEEIYSRHFFEHLTFEQGEKTLVSWQIVLQSGGKVDMILPDLNFHLKQWAAGDLKFARRGLWGKQRGLLTDTWDIHKSGYTYPDLKFLIEDLGFRDCVRINDYPKNLHVEFYK